MVSPRTSLASNCCSSAVARPHCAADPAKPQQAQPYLFTLLWLHNHHCVVCILCLSAPFSCHSFPRASHFLASSPFLSFPFPLVLHSVPVFISSCLPYVFFISVSNPCWPSSASAYWFKLRLAKWHSILQQRQQFHSAGSAGSRLAHAAPFPVRTKTPTAPRPPSCKSRRPRRRAPRQRLPVLLHLPPHIASPASRPSTRCASASANSQAAPPAETPASPCAAQKNHQSG